MKRTLWITGMLAAASCTAADAPDQPYEIGREAQHQIMLNQLTTEQMLNTLTGTALALDTLVASPLNDATFIDGSLLGPLLVDANARAFMHHLVACALEPAQSVSWTESATSTYVWEGAMGLCPDWANGAPSQACQELVSACLLSKNNANGRRVTVSTRGDDLSGTPLPLAVAMPAGTHVEFSEGTTGAQVASFGDCAVPESGVQRDCGWPADLALVGQCTPPDPGDPQAPPVIVTLGAGAPAPGDCDGPILGDSTGDLVMRVCNGVTGCNSNAALAESEGACATSAPALSFACPASGIFSVMLAPYDSDDSIPTGWAETAGQGTFPAAEADLFQVREGAFYGNLFDSSALSWQVSVYLARDGSVVRNISSSTGGPILLFEDLWACHDPGWETPSAYMHERLCATVDGADLCAATLVGSCEQVIQTLPELTRCETGHVDQGYRKCTDGLNVVRDRVITAMLKDACDMMPSSSLHLCERL